MRRRSFLQLLFSPLLAAVPALSVNTRIDKRSAFMDFPELLDPPIVVPPQEDWVVRQVWVNGVPVRHTRLLSFFPCSAEMLDDDEFGVGFN